MSEKLNFAIDGEFLTNIARDWFWNMNKSYKKCEELLLSCMAGAAKKKNGMFARTLSRAERSSLESMSSSWSMTMARFAR